MHRTVLLHEALEHLNIQPDDIAVDATLGGAGHARAIAERLGPHGVLIGIDADPEAVAEARKVLEPFHNTKIHLIEGNFRDLREILHTLHISHISKALFDLGWSAVQLSGGRGFSFEADEPLLLTYRRATSGLTARTIVNEWSEQSIADILFGWGEERYARRIARAIVMRRRQKPIETARDLAELVKKAVPAAYAFGKRHPATKTFQALRIAVNDEIGALREGLFAARELLSPGGRIAVIAFHSIEDREVKRIFLEWEKSGAGRRVAKKPLTPSGLEIRENPRARSAKLRVFEKKREPGRMLRVRNTQL